MVAFKDFNKKFTYEYLKHFYDDNVKYRCTPGIDRISRKSFQSRLDEYLGNISRKALGNTYKFTPYKERLIIKDKDKKPRVISIPTIRDKVTLGVLKEVLFDSFKSELDHKIVQSIIDDIKFEISSGKYDYFFKIDIENFFGTIDHGLLLSKIKSRIRKKEIINLISRAIKTCTVKERIRKIADEELVKGVPQGLPISNVLSSIYFITFDKKHRNSGIYSYYRYVDDILILCKSEDFNKLIKKIKNEIEVSYLLKVNKDKEDSGRITEGFSYLGYQFSGSKISVRSKSQRKLEESIEKIFIEYKHTNFKATKFFIWKLNLRITGCIRNNKKYGWLFFFSQINDMELLFHLDWLIKKLINRFRIEEKVNPNKIKKFIKAFKEIERNLHNTKYIPNFDKYTNDEKIGFLRNVAEVEMDFNDEDQIEFEFNRVIFSSIRQLERDFQDFS